MYEHPIVESIASPIAAVDDVVVMPPTLPGDGRATAGTPSSLPDEQIEIRLHYGRGQMPETAVASHFTKAALTSSGFSWAIQWPERIVSSDRFRQ